MTGGAGRATLALLALGAVLAGLIATTILDGPPDAGPARAGNTPAAAAAGGPAAPGTGALGTGAPGVDRGQWAAAALSRPLFSRSRRPPALPTTAPAAPVGLPRVTGVVLNGRDRSAILVPADGGRSVVAREGTQAAGVTVQAIQAGAVTVLAPDGPHVLPLAPDPNRPAAAPALAAPAPMPGSFPLFNGLPPPPPAGLAR